MLYTCEGCAVTFEGTPEEAFDLGWDTPERFMSHCTCSRCPITCTLWWRIAVLKEQEFTEEEVALLRSYNDIHAAYQLERVANGEQIEPPS